MSYDIYGNPLRRGHCEVHPHVHEEYPCSVCIQEENNRIAYERSESDYYEIKCLKHELELSQQRIDELEQFNLEAIKLLNAAICPCCDKSGAYYDNNGEVCQCQWCDEVSKLLQATKGE